MHTPMGSDLTVPAFQDLRACPAKAARGVAKAWSRISDIGGDMLSPKKFRASDPATPKEHMFYLYKSEGEESIPRMAQSFVVAS